MRLLRLLVAAIAVALCAVAIAPVSPRAQPRDRTHSYDPTVVATTVSANAPFSSRRIYDRPSGTPRADGFAMGSSFAADGGADSLMGDLGPAGERGPYEPEGDLKGQIHDYSCVAASCSMVAGGPEAYWREAAGVDESGGTLSNAANALTKNAYPAAYRTGMSVEDLAEATDSGPAIVAGAGHAVVVDSISDGQVFIRDPNPLGVGSAYSVSESDFASWWNGTAVVGGG